MFNQNQPSIVLQSPLHQNKNNMSLLGKQIQLKGITQRGKNLIRKHSDRWTVLAETDHILFTDHSQSQPGTWFFIAPPGCTQTDKSSRWVKEFNDSDFTVIRLDV